MDPTHNADTPYDKVLYPGGIYPQTHPNRLATVAFLRGMHPAPIDRCRVLELACGAADNLIAMAFQLPESEFVGLDVARRPIASGEAFVAQFGLQNVTLHPMDLCEASVSQLGEFDFIIAHGVYSWVPQPIRERILAICSEMLKPEGVAYVSYNAYPGNHFRDLVRGMMRFHTKPFESVTEKVGNARGLLKFLAESRPKPDYYVEAIRTELERSFKYSSDEAFFHDDLSQVNQPFYFHEFISDADHHGLQFVGEAYPDGLDLRHFTSEVAKRMSELEGASEVVREQYKDFLSGTGFRRTLLCKKEIQLAPDLQVERVRELHATCGAAPVESPGNAERAGTIFKHPNGDELESTDPLTTAALTFLCAQWPCSVHFEKILDQAKAATGGKSVPPAEGDEAALLARALAKAYHSGFLLLEVFPPKVVNRVGERPAISELARFQLKRSSGATTQLHTSVNISEPISRQLLLLLDGTRNQRMLTQELIAFVRSGGADVYEDGALVEDPNEVASILERRVQEGLKSLPRLGMLIQ
jgi:methyltransferase-like protein